MNLNELSRESWETYRLVAIEGLFHPACLLLKSVSLSFNSLLTLPHLEIKLSDEDDFHHLPGHSWYTQEVEVTGVFYDDTHYDHVFGQWTCTIDTETRTISYYLR